MQTVWFHYLLLPTRWSWGHCFLEAQPESLLLFFVGSWVPVLSVMKVSRFSTHVIFIFSKPSFKIDAFFSNDRIIILFSAFSHCFFFETYPSSGSSKDVKRRFWFLAQCPRCSSPIVWENLPLYASRTHSSSGWYWFVEQVGELKLPSICFTRNLLAVSKKRCR